MTTDDKLAGPDETGPGHPERSITAQWIGAAIAGSVGEITIHGPGPGTPETVAPRGLAPGTSPPGRNRPGRKLRLPAVLTASALAAITAVVFGVQLHPRAKPSPPSPLGVTGSATPSASPAFRLPAQATAPPVAVSHSSVVTAFHSNGTAVVLGLTSAGTGIFSNDPVLGQWKSWRPFGPGGDRAGAGDVAGTAQAITEATGTVGLDHTMLVMSDGSIQEQSEIREQSATGPLKWGTWQVIAPAGTAKVAALGLDRRGDLELYAVTPAGKLITSKQTGPGRGRWSAWTTVSTPGSVQSVTVMRQAAGYLQVMAVMADGSVEWKGEQPDNDWGPWKQIGPPGTAVEVSAGQEAYGGLNVFALTATGSVSNTYQADAAGYPWTLWRPVTNILSAVTSLNVVDAPGQEMIVIAVGADGTLRYERQDQPNGTWEGGWSPMKSTGEFARQ